MFARIISTALVALVSGYVGYQYSNHHHYKAQTNLQHHVEEEKKPILTVAGIVYVTEQDKFALIMRGKAPRGLAMFGGHVESKESPEAAFIREAKEELNVDVTNLQLIGLHGNYGRDPRQHSVEGTYLCTTSQTPVAGSDAKSVVLLTSDELKAKIIHNKESFAFDHADILEKFFDNIDQYNGIGR